MNHRALIVSLLTLSLAAAAHAAPIPLSPGTGERAGERGDGINSDMERMAQEHKHDKPTATAAATTPPSQEVTGHDVVYAHVAGKPVKGYLARPKNAKGPLPGILVIQEWWGLNDNIRQAANRLAGEGYTALAVDLYGGQVAETPEKAQELMKAAMAKSSELEDNLRQAYNHLETKEKAPKVGVIGWCFGGGWSLGTAMLLPDKIDATVIYYGRVETDKAKLARLAMPVIGFFGENDKGIPVAGVKAFESAMKELGKPVEIHIYPDADHAFANPSGGNYNEAAAKDSWQRTVAFFAKNLR